MTQIAILLAEGFEEVEAVTCLDYLRRAGMEVFLTTVNKPTVVGAHGLAVLTDLKISELPQELDALLLPGGMPGAKNLFASEKVTQLCRKMASQKKLIAAICASPAVVLGGLDLLKGRRFTCFPGFEKGISDASFIAEPVVCDDNFITSAGPGTAGVFSLAVVSYLAGEKIAQRLAQEVLLDPPEEKR